MDLVERPHVLLDVADLAGGEERAPHPEQEVAHGAAGDQHEPEPEEDEDLLVEQVDGQDALHGERLDVLKLPDLEIAQGDFGEPGRVAPVAVLGEPVDDLEAVQVVPAAHEGVEQEKLAHDVDHE